MFDDVGGRTQRLLVRFAGASFSRCAIFIIVLAGVFSLLSPHFLSATNLSNIVTASAAIALLGIGVTFVIAAGGIDLSVASVMALSGTACASLAQQYELNGVAALIVCSLIGAMCGVCNGALVNLTRAPSFIVTLGVMSVARAAAYIVSDGLPIYGLSDSIISWGQQSLIGIPMPVIVVLCATIVAYLILHRATLGAQLLWYGDNPGAAEAVGVDVASLRLKAFALCGFFAGVGGYLFMARTNAGDPTAGLNYELVAITGCILGGSSLFGGRATIIGTLLGILSLGALQNGLTLLAVSNYYQVLFVGMVLIGAALLERFGERR
jgi:ribose/xylose/arabinose/galactoside ABC-type transport system permease subunit